MHVRPGVTAARPRSRTLPRGLLLFVHAAAATVVAGCASALGPAPGTAYDVSADRAFTAAERAELDGCAADWSRVTSGRVSIRFVDGADGDLALERRGPAPGGYRKHDREAWIDADAMYAEGFDARTGVRAMCLNLVGQFFGVRLHDGRGALSRDDVVPYFTDEDLGACRAADLCD